MDGLFVDVDATQVAREWVWTYIMQELARDEEVCEDFTIKDVTLIEFHYIGESWVGWLMSSRDPLLRYEVTYNGLVEKVTITSYKTLMSETFHYQSGL